MTVPMQKRWACPAFTDTFDRLRSLGGVDGGEQQTAAVLSGRVQAGGGGGDSGWPLGHGGRAAELGLPDRLVRAWLRWAEGRTAAGSGAPVPTPVQEQAAPARRVGPSPADQAAEIGRLRRELDRVRMERDILGKAALIFGRATGRR